MNKYPIDRILLTKSFPSHSPAVVGINSEADYYNLLNTLHSTSAYDELSYCDWPSNNWLNGAKECPVRHLCYKHLGLREKKEVIKELAKGEAARLVLTDFGEKQDYEDEQELMNKCVGEEEDGANSSLA